MDRRGWLWKKRSSDATEKKVAAPDSVATSLDSSGSQGNQYNSKKENYVQISVESYTHLTELAGQVKALNDEVNTLKEKLSSAHSEMTTKDNLVNQHAKVAEEAILGWEKAEAEASALKHQLESVTHLKLTADDRAMHLDGALKECMRQIQSIKEEHEQKLHEIVCTQTKQWEKKKLEFEKKVVNLDQELHRLSAENVALSRSLHEHSDMILKISEEKSQAEVEIELLKTDIQSYERETSSLKYELHLVSKELEIRNEEKNMSLRSAEVANKQHSEGVKKIAKLEAECQRLRGLVRKKLPGPAALAQMKLEVENLGRDYGETQLRQSPLRSPSTHLFPLPEFSPENIRQCDNEVQFLMERLLATEEETKMLKEALAKRNTELQASRSMFGKMASKLQNFEAELKLLNQDKGFRKSIVEILSEDPFSQIASYPPSSASITEEVICEEVSSTEIGATTFISDLSQLEKERKVDNGSKDDNRNHLELMDDFLEMERLAHLSTESSCAISVSCSSTEKRIQNEDDNASTYNVMGGDCGSEQKPLISQLDNHISSNVVSTENVEYDMEQFSLSKHQSKFSMIFESESKASDLGNLQDIKNMLQNIKGALPQQSGNCIFEKKNSSDESEKQHFCPQDTKETKEIGTSSILDGEPGTNTVLIIDEKLSAAILQIRDFVISLGKVAIAVKDNSPDEHGLKQRIEEFCTSVNKLLCSEISVVDFVLDLSHVLEKASEVRVNAPSYNENDDVETESIDCKEKLALLEKKVDQFGSLRGKYPNGCVHSSHSTSDSEVLQEGCVSPSFEMPTASWRSLLEELEQLKSEKDSTLINLAQCTEKLEHTESQLREAEQHLAELKSQLESSKKSNSLMETQLKCMAESYRSLELRLQELDAEMNLLQSNAQTLEDELREEKQNHQIALTKCKDFEEQMQRNGSCSKCSLLSAADVDIKSRQEKEIAAAADKLVECQEAILLLDRQLKALHPQQELLGRPNSERHQKSQTFMDVGSSTKSLNPLRSSEDSSHSEMENSASPNISKQGGETHLNAFNSPLLSPPKTDANQLLRSPISSKSPKRSSLSSFLSPDKHSYGFSRFFSPKRE